MAALTYAAVLERLHGDAGALLKATSEPLSDGLSTQHSCFRRTRGSGGSSGPSHLHMVFLRSRRPECSHFCTSLPSATHRSCFFPLISSFLAPAQFFLVRPTHRVFQVSIQAKRIRRQGGDFGRVIVTTMILWSSTHRLFCCLFLLIPLTSLGIRFHAEVKNMLLPV